MTASFWAWYGEAAQTAVGFFWNSSWAFVLGLIAFAVTGGSQ